MFSEEKEFSENFSFLKKLLRRAVLNKIKYFYNQVT